MCYGVPACGLQPPCSSLARPCLQGVLAPHSQGSRFRHLHACRQCNAGCIVHSSQNTIRHNLRAGVRVDGRRMQRGPRPAEHTHLRASTAASSSGLVQLHPGCGVAPKGSMNTTCSLISTTWAFANAAAAAAWRASHSAARSVAASMAASSSPTCRPDCGSTCVQQERGGERNQCIRMCACHAACIPLACMWQ